MIQPSLFQNYLILDKLEKLDRDKRENTLAYFAAFSVTNNFIALIIK
jgi:hypothetical protein